MSKQNFSNLLVSALSGAVMTIVILLGVFTFTDFFEKPDIKTEENLSSTKEVNQVIDYKSQEDIVVSTIEKASPAVVSIIITKDVPVLEQYFEDMSSPFDDFMFGSPFSFQVPKYRDSGKTEQKEIGGGSGFIVSPDGYLITNKHVVDTEDADYTVFLADGTKYEAKIIDKDDLNDIAVLKIEAENLPFLEFGDSEALKVGQSVIAIGNPLLEFKNSASVGIISGLSRSIHAATSIFGKTEALEDVIQTDAAINPGNSGGPLLNLDGKVIGVNVAIANGENIGFSLPSNVVKSIYDSVKENGKIVRPYLGVRYVQINKAIKENNKLDTEYGVLVLRGEKIEDLAVIPGSPADKAGIMENDIILEIDGIKLEEGKSLVKIISSKKPGDSVKLKLLSKGKEKEISVVLEEVKD
ncbi:MAG: trypsin-like peptidase domain-containing protein [Candidatus Gracilibacteria bacterium]|jgi:serine protease Do|nr:trypsin-like peptidase domain-containing protein [Candidatus Gracilibacteria bacterium]